MKTRAPCGIGRVRPSTARSAARLTSSMSVAVRAGLVSVTEAQPARTAVAASRTIRRAVVKSPGSDVGHGGPGLGRGQTLAALQQLDRDAVGRADEGHMAVARRTIDHDPAVHQTLAGGVDILDLE